MSGQYSSDNECHEVCSQSGIPNVHHSHPLLRMSRRRLAIVFCCVFAVGSLVTLRSVEAANAPVMIVPGQFGVSASGAATYSIPITVPPGTAGVVPSLSLDYSSQSGNGLVGLGWMLSGLSSVERCPRTYAQDGIHGSVNYDTNDRYCFGGQRLVAVSGTYGADGTQYRTEIDTFSKVISYGSQGNGPAYFLVWTKSGQIMEFGNTSDSRALTNDGSNTARSWALNKVSDVKGNYYTVTYVNDTTNGQVYPSRIDYTGNATVSLSPYNSVQFVYNTARLDTAILYHAGSFTKPTVLLTNVQAYAGSNLVYDYRLSYEAGTTTRHSRLTSVTLCDAGSNCLKPTTFGWQGSRDTISITTAMSGVLGSSIHVVGDFNGDGLIDLLGNGTAPATTTPLYTSSLGLKLNNGNLGVTISTITTTYSGIANASDGPISLQAIDLSGSGISDFSMMQTYANAYVHPLTHEQMPLLLLWMVKNIDGSTARGTGTVYGSYGTTCCASRYANILGDFNGDGRQEYIGALGNGDGTFTTDSVHPAPSSYTSIASTADFDGDGCTDVLLQSSSAHSITYYCNAATSSLTVPNWTSANTITGDFNGDGMSDILVLPYSTSTSGALYFSTGIGLVASSFVVPTSWNGTSTSNQYGHTIHQTLTGDWNGDGRTDIAIITNTAISVYLSTGTGFVLANSTAISASSFNGGVVDLNGDGVNDLLVKDVAYIFSYVPEFLISVSNGLGATTSITYDRLNKNGSLYTKCPANSSSYVCGDSYPTQAVDGSIYVVSRVDSSNGRGGSFSATYAYAGYKANLRGRGGLGFAQVKATDVQSGIVSTTTYHQDYPYIGQVDTQTTTLNGVTLSSAANTYELANLGTSVEGVTRYFAGLTQTIVTGNDADGSPLPSTTVTYRFDCQDSTTCYGNMVLSTETVSMSGTTSSTKTTTNTYSNDANNWFIGRLTGTTVIRTKN